MTNHTEQAAKILAASSGFDKQAMIKAYHVWLSCENQERLEVGDLMRAKLHLATEEQMQWTHQLFQGLIVKG